MEDKTISKAHKVTLNNRRSGNFTGILDVISFDIGEVLLETELGMLHIKGKDLHVNRLNLEKGEVDIEGLIEAFHYSPVPIGIKGKDSLLGKLFH
jgi:sporulation protein YabP